MANVQNLPDPATRQILFGSQIPKGPDYIDTSACRCALRTIPVSTRDANGNEVAWRCIGNQTTDPYNGSSGKWFYPQTTGSKDDQNDDENSATNPPDLSTSYIIKEDGPDADPTFTPLTPSDQSQLSPLDIICNGQNDTTSTGLYYQEIARLRAGLPPQLCADPNAVPIPLQNESSWNETGCLEGFYCPVNSIQRLPQFCPPVVRCQHARLAGGNCGIPMGILEPRVCPAGKYCPFGGKQQLNCTSGHFCPLGSVEPLSCSLGASCTTNAAKNQSVLAIGLLAVLDLALILWLLWAKLVKKTLPEKSKHKRGSGPGHLLQRASTMISHGQDVGQYQKLGDEEIRLESRISSVKRANTGFLAVIDNDYSFDDDHSTTSDPMEEKSNKDLNTFVSSLSRCVESSTFGLSFEFENLSFFPKKSVKPVLSQITGSVEAGAFLGVMGASGAGKSTFVNVLMGKQAHTGGMTKVNGVPGQISKYKKIIGYVPQDDIVLPELTVRENILHSARIRLPASWKEDEIQKHVDVLLSCLQLSHVKDSLVGSTAAPVISGGQRKRVSIGMELAAAPMALFLDEPTSGLDATSANSIMMTLKALSKLGITVVTIIHQPRREIFKSLDTLMLFGAGRLIYSGKEADAQRYFEGCGFTFPEHGNPADAMIDIIAGQGHLYKKSGDTNIQALIDNWKNRQESSPHLSLQKTPQLSTKDTISLRQSIKQRGAPWYSQILHCLRRALLQQYRLWSSFAFELLVGALAGFLIGLAEMSQEGNNFRGLYRDPYTLLSSSIDYSSVLQMSLLVGLAIGLTASAPGVKIFGEERLVYWREAAAGHNRFAYYIGKVLSTIPRMLLANLHFTTLFHLLATPRIDWGSAFIINLAYFYCIYGLASIISMITRREDGPLLATVMSLIVGVISGMSPTLVTVAGWHMTWLWRASPGTWLSEGYFDKNVSPWAYLYQIEDAENYIGLRVGRYWLDVGMLFVLGTAYRVLAFLLMRGLGRRKQRGDVFARGKRNWKKDNTN